MRNFVEESGCLWVDDEDDDEEEMEVGVCGGFMISCGINSIK